MIVARGSRLAGLCAAATLALALPARASAQTASASAFTACTPSGFVNCVLFQLNFDRDVAPGLNQVRVAVQNLGSISMPGTPTSIYSFIFGTGADAAEAGTEVDALVSPQAKGGAVVTDASAWSVFDSGDAIFFSALSNNGIGNCVASGPVDGFGQSALTCGPGSFASFSFFTPRTYDLERFTLAAYEVVALTDGLPAGSCGADACVTTSADLVVTPEPATLLLTASGLASIAAARARRKKKTAVTGEA